VFGALDLFVGPGARIGFLGPNGCGKSTLLRVLTGQDVPTGGEVLRADSLQVAFFEQNRESLDQDRALADTVCPDGDFVEFRGVRQHRHGYLERFLFRSDQMMLPVGRLSGGEQSRLLIARLMLRPANLLVLDEPTNDLDLPTLQVLEDALTSFDGAVLLVSHDRYFLDQVATQILAFHTKPGEEGMITPFAGLAQWDAWHPTQAAPRGKRAREAAASAGAGAVAAALARPAKKKLSFKDQRDWETVEARIAATEARLAALERESQSPAAVVDGAQLVALATEMEQVRGEIDALYARWAQLEAMQS
jgi:ATP-binding cassette subfamily F protein uup